MPEREIGEAEFEVVLREEQVVVEKVVVPKEQIRLETDVVVEDREIRADLRKEEITVERDDA